MIYKKSFEVNKKQFLMCVLTLNIVADILIVNIKNKITFFKHIHGLIEKINKYLLNYWISLKMK